VLQATAAAVSAMTAVYLARITVQRDREIRRERIRDEFHEQMQRLFEALQAMAETMALTMGGTREFEMARAQLAAAVALDPNDDLSAVEALLADDMPKPPYNIGEGEGWKRHEEAMAQVLAYARAFG
jgi:hypothetical protein